MDRHIQNTENEFVLFNTNVYFYLHYLLNLTPLHRPYHTIETLDAALQEVENIPAYLPNCLQLKDVVSKAKKWLHEAETLQVKYTLSF